MRQPVILILLIGLSIVRSFSANDPRYRVIRIDPPIGVEPYGMIGAAINNRGEVIGTWGVLTPDGPSLGQQRAFLYTDASGIMELDLPEDWNTQAADINDAGQILLGTGVVPFHDEAPYRYTPGVGLEYLGTFGGENNEPKAINSQGQVAGWSELSNLDVFSFRYTDGIGLENLGGLFGGEESSARAINDSGWVAGASAEHAFLFRDDMGMVDLGPGIAYGINNQGAVVGRAFVTEGHPFTSEEAFLYLDGQRHLLGRIADRFGEGSTGAYDINNSNVVVGIAYIFDIPLNPRIAGMIWTEHEGMRELNDLIDPNSGLYVVYGGAINDYGQITGSGVFQDGEVNNWGATFRLDPIPPRLSIQRGPANVEVSWSPAWPGIVLEGTESLVAPDWQSLNTGGTNVMILAMDSPQRFFRLNLEGIRGLCCAPQ